MEYAFFLHISEKYLAQQNDSVTSEKLINKYSTHLVIENVYPLSAGS